MISRYVAIVGQLEALEKERCELRDRLVASESLRSKQQTIALQGANGEKIEVVYPNAKIVITPDKVDSIRKQIGEENFKKLVERIIVWKAVKSCRDVAARILSGIQRRRFLELTEVETAPYIRIL